MIIAVFTPHGGCPERCRFCDQSVSGGSPLPAVAVARAIDEHLLTSADGRAQEIAFYGGTFTAMARERQVAYLEAALPYLRDGRIGETRVSTRPDALEDEDWLLTLRDRYRVRTVEIGAQSFNARVLHRLGRSHSAEQTACALLRLRRLKIRVGLHLMIGCPDENGSDDSLTAEWLERLRPEYLRIHPLLVLAGTPLEREWERGRFAPLSLADAVRRTAGLTRRAEALGIQVIRLGLQPNDLLGMAVRSGPYHPAFGELVRARLLRDRIEAWLEQRVVTPGATVEIQATPRAAGQLRSQGGVALAWLRQRFALSSMRVGVLQDARHGDRDFEIRVLDPARSAQRGQIELAQRPRRRALGHRHSQGADDLATHARVLRPARP